MVASHFNGWVIDDGGEKRAFRYATPQRQGRVPKGTPVGDNRGYQPLKRLATSVKPLWGLCCADGITAPVGTLHRMPEDITAPVYTAPTA